jgi:hypothetical protein
VSKELTEEQRLKRNDRIRNWRKRPEVSAREKVRKDNPDYKKHYKERYSHHRLKRKIRVAEMRKFVFEIKKTLKCEKCGFNKHPAALQFHHKDPKEKEMTIKNLCNRISKENILEEIKKCQVLCANCHQILHFEEKPNASYLMR